MRRWLIVFMLGIVPAASAQNPFPVTTATSVIQAAFQTFEGGYMIWEGDTGAIHVLMKEGSNRHYYMEDSYAAWPDNPVTESPPAGRIKPHHGFGRVWGNVPEVRQALGWAIENETAYSLTTTRYGHPHTYGPVTDAELHFPNGQKVIIYSNGTWAFAAAPLPDPHCICSLPQTITMRASIQVFEGGYMLYWSETGSIWVLTNDGRARLFVSSSYGNLENDPVKENPPAGLYRPILGFGKVWGYFPEVRQKLGWAAAKEQPYTMRFERIWSGNDIAFLVTVPGGQRLVITDDDTWHFVN